jgi:hypothetical protein
MIKIEELDEMRRMSIRERSEKLNVPMYKMPMIIPKPKSSSKDIPLGVKLTDEEIANGVAWIKVLKTLMIKRGWIKVPRVTILRDLHNSKPTLSKKLVFLGWKIYFPVKIASCSPVFNQQCIHNRRKKWCRISHRVSLFFYKPVEL